MLGSFDQIVVVDWSASSRPAVGRDSIWVAVRDADGLDVTNPPTRHEAEAHLGGVLTRRRARRSFLGVDFSLGFPAGTAAALRSTGVPWRTTWGLLAELVVDEPSNRNNRFDVAAELNRRITGRPSPFWGVPPSSTSPMLGPTKPRERGPLPEWRAAERRLRQHGLRPFSVWQLLGAGAVGGQTLLGIPVLERLRSRASGRVRIWPFEAGGDPSGPGDDAIVVAEVWPTLFGDPPSASLDAGPEPGSGPGSGPRDRRQVTHVAERLWAIDDGGGLGRLLAGAPDVPAVRREEGWVLGAEARCQERSWLA